MLIHCPGPQQVVLSHRELGDSQDDQGHGGHWVCSEGRWASLSRQPDSVHLCGVLCRQSVQMQSQVALGQGWELPGWERGLGSGTFQGHAPGSPPGHFWDKVPLLEAQVLSSYHLHGLLLPPGLDVMDQSWMGLILRSTVDIRVS